MWVESESADVYLIDTPSNQNIESLFVVHSINSVVSVHSISSGMGRGINPTNWHIGARRVFIPKR